MTLPVRVQTTLAASKVVDWAVLGVAVDNLKRQGKKVIHCHGVFDLLHIGHLRHFEQAKKLGDVLIVTLTADEHVNKGPHRPAFSHTMRAEMLAALDVVDYVAINQWPTAVETIRFLRPDYYVKGPDYQNAAQDRTGKILDEELAVRSVGGEIRFTEGDTYSSTTLINDHLSVQPDETKAFLQGIRERYSIGDIVRMIEALQAVSVLTVGESIIDEYQYCEAIGKSSKEPTLVVKVGAREAFAGGVLAIANHAAGFAGRTGVITHVGDANNWADFARENLAAGVAWHGLVRHGAPTIVKRRYIDTYFFTKLFETYEIRDDHLLEHDEARLAEVIAREAGRYDVVVVADYGHEFFTDTVVRTLKDTANFLAVNVQSNAGSLGYQSLQRYAGADFFSIDETELRLEARDRRGNIEALAHLVGEASRGKTLFVTRGKYGSMCYRPGQELLTIPAVAGKVVDRVGAGDAFLAITALCAQQNIPADVTGFLGSTAGALSVATVGNKQPITKLGLIRTIESLLK